MSPQPQSTQPTTDELDESVDEQADDQIEEIVVEQIPEGHVGRHMVSWEIDEFPVYSRGTRWYIIMGVSAAALILYAVFTANFVFAVLILMFVLITMANQFRQPEKLNVVITTQGIAIGEEFHEYKDVRDFSVVYDPPAVKRLYVAFSSAFRPTLSLPLEDTDPNIVREHLLKFCQENLDRDEESLSDILRRLYRI